MYVFLYNEKSVEIYLNYSVLTSAVCMGIGMLYRQYGVLGDESSFIGLPAETHCRSCGLISSVR